MAEAGSIDLLMTLAGDADNPGFVLIGACRANDMTTAHPLSVALREPKDDGVVVNEIPMSNLKLEAANTMLSDILRRSPAETRPLLEIVSRCTDCNAFLVKYFLRSLYEERLLRTDQERGQWVWDEALIVERFSCRDVLQFVLQFVRNA